MGYLEGLKDEKTTVVYDEIENVTPRWRMAKSMWWTLVCAVSIFLVE